MKTNKLGKQVQTYIYILIIIVLAMAYLGFSQSVISFVEDIFVKYVIISAITSAVAGSLVESLTGNSLKSIFLNVEVKGIKFSLSFFVIAVFILKIFIFR